MAIDFEGLVTSRRETVDELMKRLMQLSAAENPEIDQLFGNIAAQRGAAESEATQLGGQAQRLRAEPEPTTDPTADLLTRGIAAVAGSLQQSDNPRAAAEETIKAEQKQMMLKRTADLTRLDQMYEKAIERANKLQDDERAMQFAEKKMKIAQELETHFKLLGAAVQEEGDALQAAATMQAARIRAATAGAGKQVDPEILEAYTDGAVSGQIEMGAIQPSYYRAYVIKRAQERGEVILNAKGRAILDNITGAKGVMHQLTGIRGGIKTGKGGVERSAVGIQNMVKKWFQVAEGPRIAAFEGFRKGILASIVRAVGERGTLTDGDIKRAEAFLPNLVGPFADSEEAVVMKLTNLSNLLDEFEQRTIKNHSYKLPGQRLDAEPMTIEDRLKAKGF